MADNTTNSSYRQDAVKWVHNCWRRGESCSIIGGDGPGKSDLLRHLASKQMLDSYRVIAAEDHILKTIVIDPSMIRSDFTVHRDNELQRFWVGYEVMMNRLYLAFQPLDTLANKDKSDFLELYRAFLDGKNPLFSYMGFRYFEIALDIFMRNNFKLVFMFDNLETLMKFLPPKFFTTLRAIRDSYKDRISFLTASKDDIPDILDNLPFESEQYEPFVELFYGNKLVLKSLDQE